jgi:hypothetical protein
LAENKLTFLTEVELPDYCFMSEAVEWIAFGRVPQIQHSEFEQPGEVVDSRFFWAERLENFEPPYDYPWFDRLEFELLSIPVTEDYFEAAEKCYDEDVHHLPSHIAEYEAKGEIVVEQDQGSKQSRYKEYATKLRQELAELGPLQALVDKVEADFEPHRQIACAKLFQLLAAGLVESQAIDLERWESLSDEGEDEKAIRFDNVPPKAYSLAHKWMENEIVFDEREHVALRVKTQDILDHSSTLLQSGRAVSVNRIGVFYVSSSAGRTNRQTRRGRRSAVDWSQLKAHLLEMAQCGELPDSKENCIYELIAFAERELDKAPSRTSVQRKMGAELDAHYAQN